MKILLLGDTHADTAFTISALEFAAKHGFGGVLQLGDFGFWPRAHKGPAFLTSVSNATQRLAVPLYWLAGNHEDYISLAALYETLDGPFYEHHPGVHHIRSGTAWTWDTIRIGALSGAVSIDRQWRKLGVDYFTEEVTDSALVPGLGQLDLLLTHDAPCPPPGMGNVFKRDPFSAANQRKIADAIHATGAKTLVHGHWHHYERWGFEGCHVHSLDCNGTGLHRASAVLDTAAGTLQTIGQFHHDAPGHSVYR